MTTECIVFDVVLVLIEQDVYCIFLCVGQGLVVISCTDLSLDSIDKVDEIGKVLSGHTHMKLKYLFDICLRSLLS